jgi:hypothetical protein
MSDHSHGSPSAAPNPPDNNSGVIEKAKPAEHVETKEGFGVILGGITSSLIIGVILALTAIFAIKSIWHSMTAPSTNTETPVSERKVEDSRHWEKRDLVIAADYSEEAKLELPPKSRIRWTSTETIILEDAKGAEHINGPSDNWTGDSNDYQTLWIKSANGNTFTITFWVLEPKS